MKNFPIFIFPVSLEFYLGARHTYRQLLTLYNPYDFPVNFKVLCTSPNKFTVIDPEGVIASQSCIDIVVRYTQPSASHCNISEKFRITMYDRNSHQTLGKRDVIAQLIDGEPINSNEGTIDNFHPLVSKQPTVKQEEDVPRQSVCFHPTRYRQQEPVNIVAIVVSICCIGVLLLPTQPDPAPHTQWPEWTYVGANLKLVSSFVLGLVSTLVLRP